MKTSPLSDKLALEWDRKLKVNPRALLELSELIYSVISKPWLGNATTDQLLDEVKARVELGYGGGRSGEIDLAP